MLEKKKQLPGVEGRGQLVVVTQGCQTRIQGLEEEELPWVCKFNVS